jgi:hypothetical protein
MKERFLNLMLIFAVMFMLPASTIASDSDITWHGYLMDSDSVKLFNKGSSVLDFVQDYDSKAALGTKSKAADYMLFADKWYHLDKRGNELALEAIRRSIKHKGFYVIVEGKLKNGTIAVARLTEITNGPDVKAQTVPRY